MNRTIGIALSLFTLTGTGTLALANEAGPQDPGCADKRAAFHEKKLERFDLDKDGKLSPQEREQMRAQMKERHAQKRAEMLQRFDLNKDGVLDASEQAAMKTARAERLFERLDANKDGQLSTEEVRCTPLAGQFAKLDTDSSGTLSITEVQAARLQHGWHHHRGHEQARRHLKARTGTV